MIGYPYLHLESTFQELDEDLTSIALLGSAADKMLYTTSANVWAETTLTSAGRAILDDANNTAQRTTLGLGTGDSPVFAGLTVNGSLSAVATGSSPIIAERSSAQVDTSLRALELRRTMTGTAEAGIGVELAFKVEDGGGGVETTAAICGVLMDVSAESEEGALVFEVVSDSSLVEGMRLQGISGGSANLEIPNGSLNTMKGFATQLWDVAGGHFETAVVNTEYYSPNQHGNIWGTIYRQYFTTTLASTSPRLDTGGRVTKLIDWTLYVHSGSDFHIMCGYFRGFVTGEVTIKDASNNLSFLISGFTLDNGWVDYTK